MATRKKRRKKKSTRKKSTRKKSARKKSARRKTTRKRPVDLSTLSYDQLQVVADEAARRADKLREQRLAELEEKWRLEAEELGFTFDEVVGRGRRRRKKASKKRSTRRGRPAKKSRRGRSTATYVNPDDPSQTWSGRGRRPNWLQDYLKGGGDLEALRR